MVDDQLLISPDFYCRLSKMFISYLFLALSAYLAAAATNNNQSSSVKLSPSPCFDPVESRGQYVVSKDGLKLYSESVGCKSAPSGKILLTSNPSRYGLVADTATVILVTGFACSHLAFERLWNDPELREKLYMVRYDPRGHGLTDKPLDPASYESERYADDVKAIVDTYGLDMPFFCGWSYGASTAADIATYFPSPLPFSGYCSFAG
jgi:pimeloyl-ACP methyl ester carboxylesterase